MLKHAVLAAVLALTLAAPTFAQAPTATAQPAPSNAVEACIAQMHRLAGLNKGLAANWNADRVRRDCEARVSGQ